MKMVVAPENNIASYSAFTGPGTAHDAIRSHKHAMVVSKKRQGYSHDIFFFWLAVLE